MTKNYYDSNWREEYKGYTSSKYELDLLENGPHSLAQSWMMGALHNKWKKMKGYKDPEPPDCQSSLSESLKNGVKCIQLRKSRHQEATNVFWSTSGNAEV